ncbi:MAG TPA: ATP-dependent helicase, partial [bacterium]|nr:ATP-dependent helicase [bacterium]
MSLIRLTPSAHLVWDPDDTVRQPAVDPGALPNALAAARVAFRRDWREGLFRLAAEKVSLDGLPPEHAVIVRFWQEFAGGYLTALSHIPESATSIDVLPPQEAWLGRFILSAPPMTGGEYLSPALLRQIWDRLAGWGLEQIGPAANLARFLTQRAPAWNQVGRVCFHLAENKNAPGQPFAFMAAYASGFTADGRLKYLPLHRALKVYSGEAHRRTLINLLTPVHRAAAQVGWVSRLVRSNAIYQPMQWSPSEAYEFLKTSHLLESCG